MVRTVSFTVLPLVTLWLATWVCLGASILEYPMEEYTFSAVEESSSAAQLIPKGKSNDKHPWNLDSTAVAFESADPMGASNPQTFQKVQDKAITTESPVMTEFVILDDSEPCDSAIHKMECRVIIVYSDNGCEIHEDIKTGKKQGLLRTAETGNLNFLHDPEAYERSEPGSESLRVGTYGGEANMNGNAGLKDQVRDRVMKLYTRRLLDAFEKKQGEALAGQNINDTRRSNPEIKSRYLKSMNMEVTVIPSPLSDVDGVKLAEGLPCVDFVSRDFVRHINPTDSQIDHVKLDPENSASKESEEPTPKYRSPTPSLPSELTSPVQAVIYQPNDPFISRQWHLLSSVPSSIRADITWRRHEIPSTEGGDESSLSKQKSLSFVQTKSNIKSVVVAVLDNGCEIGHPDLQDQLWHNPLEICGDGLDNDNNGFVDDCYGWDFVEDDPIPNPGGSTHGTAVAGIIAATRDNHIGVAGVCANCKLMCLRFINGTRGVVSSGIAALDYAVTHGAKISNNSYGGYGYSQVEYLAIERAQKAGHLFVASAGNDNRNTDRTESKHTPSGYKIDNILSVGASSKNGVRAPFSNYGTNSVDIFAPGAEIMTTDEGGGYAVVSGTSFSAPVGAGAAGVIWGEFPDLNYTEIINSLVYSCNRKQLGPRGLSRCSGIIDLPAARLRAALMMKVGRTVEVAS